jgi:putative hemolysin
MILQDVSSLDLFIQKVQLGNESFDRMVPLSLESERYLLKTVDHFSELQSALRLRHDVFFARGLAKKLKFELDVDFFDRDSDHLVVIDKQTGKIVGNYRIRCSVFHSRFYSESEFRMDELLSRTGQGKIEPGVRNQKVEIGRACIDPEHRSGTVIQLLWRGLLHYMRTTQSRYLFGCSSISTHVPNQIEYVWNYLNKNDLIDKKLHVQPRHPFIFRKREDEPLEKVELPPLLFSYIRSGAKVLGPPAFDPEFECADFFTLLDLNDLTERRARRYEATLQAALKA